MRRPALVVLLLGAGASGALAQGRGRITDRGLDSLRAAVRVDSVDAEAYYRLGLGLWEKRKYDQADTAFARAMRLAPDHAGARLAAAMLPYGRGRRYRTDLAHRISADSMTALDRRAVRLHREAYLLDPLVDPRILRHLPIEQLVPRRTLGGSEEAPMLAPSPLWWERRAREGVAALVAGHADSAYAILDGVLNSTRMRQGATLPDVFVWYFGLAAAHAGHFDHAAASFLELSQRMYRREVATPDWVVPGSRADYLYLYGVMSERSGQQEVAVAALQAALESDLGLVEAHVRLADTYQARGEFTPALTERLRAVHLRPEDGTLHRALGITLLRSGQAGAAESSFAEAARLLPDDPDIQRTFAMTALQNGHPDRAKAALIRFLAVAPARRLADVAEARRQLAALP